MAYINRKIYSEIVSHLKNKEITIITGPRQSGKTTIVKKLIEGCAEKNFATVFLNMDVITDASHLVDQQTLLEYLRYKFGNKPGIVFVDEIQRIENAGIFLKGLYDMEIPYKFVVTGSGSIDLKGKIQESLSGRKRVFRVNTVSFREFLDYRLGTGSGNTNIVDFYKNEPRKADELFREYLRFGGYPKIVTLTSEQEKIAEVQEILSSFMEKDIKNFLDVKKSYEFEKLMKIIAAEVGTTVNVEGLGNELALNRETINKYVWYLNQTYILDIVRPYYTNIRKELVKMPVYYYHDLGMRNYLFNNLRYSHGVSETGGFLFQNFVHRLLTESPQYQNTKICYWRSKNGAEVDFVAEQGYKKVTPIEVKAINLVKPSVTKSMASFIDTYSPERAVFVNLSLDEAVDFNGCRVEFIPYWKLLL